MLVGQGLKSSLQGGTTHAAESGCGRRRGYEEARSEKEGREDMSGGPGCLPGGPRWRWHVAPVLVTGLGGGPDRPAEDIGRPGHPDTRGPKPESRVQETGATG